MIWRLILVLGVGLGFGAGIISESVASSWKESVTKWPDSLEFIIGLMFGLAAIGVSIYFARAIIICG